MQQGELRNPVNAEFICRRIARAYTLTQIAGELGCVASSITDWVAADADFAAMYARAKLAQADYMADEIVAIADEGSNDWMQRELEAGRIVEVPDHEHINRSRLRVDTRKWLMSKMAPKKYGDKLQHTGADGEGPVVVVTGVRRDGDG